MTIAVTVVTAIKQWHIFNITKTSHCSALITGPITNNNYEALKLQRYIYSSRGVLLRWYASIVLNLAEILGEEVACTLLMDHIMPYLPCSKPVLDRKIIKYIQEAIIDAEENKVERFKRIEDYIPNDAQSERLVLFTDVLPKYKQKTSACDNNDKVSKRMCVSASI